MAYLHNTPLVLNPVLTAYREARQPGNNWHDSAEFFASHAIERAKERYNFTLTRKDWERLNWMIWRDVPETRLICVRNDTVSCYEIEFTPWVGRKRTFRVYFNENVYCVTSFVPMNAWEVRPHPKGVVNPGYNERQAAKRSHGMTKTKATEPEKVSQPAPVIHQLAPAPKVTNAEIRARLFGAKEMERSVSLA